MGPGILYLQRYIHGCICNNYTISGCNTIAVSFNDGIDAVKGGIHIWPRIFTTKNYATVLGKQNIKTAAFITVARTVIGSVLSLATNYNFS